MPRKKWIDKANATTFQLVHRSQNDPRIHDEASNSMVFREVAPSQSHKIKDRKDLELELFGDASRPLSGFPIRDNEGEAAEHGIYFDDTEYDYMQHIRDLKSGDINGESFFVETYDGNKQKGKGKAKVSLEEALRQSSLQDEPSANGASTAGSLVEADSQSLQQASYQNQQDVPDEIAGFQPDMDPRLREVLQALDDDAYVDDEEEIFGEITRDNDELTLDEFEDGLYQYDDEEEGWESDSTEKPLKEYTQIATIPHPSATLESAPSHLNEESMSASAPPPSSSSAGPASEDWMSEFRKFKQSQQQQRQQPRPPHIHPKHTANANLDADAQSTLLSSFTSDTGADSILTAGGTRRKKKRKGALTSSTSFSMTSSSLARTEGQTLLDARFDRIEEAYADDIDMIDEEDEDEDDNDPEGSEGEAKSVVTRDSRRSLVSNTTSRSGVSESVPPQLVRKDFEGIMDEFLDGYAGGGGAVKKRGRKNGGYAGGLAELDEVRRGLGPARVNVRT